MKSTRIMTLTVATMALILLLGTNNVIFFKPLPSALAQSSPIVFNPVNGHYYEAIFVPGGINWFDAKSAAEGRTFRGAQGHLVTTVSQQEHDFVTGALPQVRAPMTSPFGAGYWLGGFQPPASPEPAGGWRWITSETFFFNGWISGEPNNFGSGGEDGLAYWWYPGANGEGRRWSDIPRTFLAPGYVVEYEVTNIAYNPNNGHYYEAVPTTMNGIDWEDAKAAAESRTHGGMQGRLATITSPQEQDFIVRNLPQVKAPVILHGAGYWLGGFQPPASPEPAGGWRWITDEPFTFQFWQPNEPNNNGGNEDSLIFWGNPGSNSGDGAKWNDAPSNYLAPGYVVEYATPPTANAGPDQTVNEAETVTLDGSASTITGSNTIVSYKWEQVITGTEPPVTLTEDGVNNDDATTATAKFVAPNVGSEGEKLSFKLTVMDNEGGTAEDTVAVTVKNVNQAPRAENDHYTVLEDTALEVPAPGILQNDNDPDGGTLTAINVSSPANGVLELGQDGSFSYTPDSNFHGIDSFNYNASDGTAPSNTATVEIAVDPANDPPTPNAGADDTVEEGEPVTLDGTGSLDQDGTISSYSWTQTAGAPVTLDNANIATPSFTAPAVGSDGDTLIFELTVTDNEGATSTTPDAVSITVNNVNQNPIANAGADDTVEEGEPVTLDGTASSDPDGSIQSYSWTQTSGTTTVELDDATSSTPSFTAPAVGSDGDTLIFELTVTDNDGGTSTDSVDIHVGNVNQPPTANAGEDQTVDEGTSGVQLDGSASTDTDGNIASYQWEQTSGPSVTLNDAGTATPTFDAPEVTANTDLTFTLTVTDNDRATDDDDIVVIVNDVAEPPPEETTVIELRGFYSPVDMNDVTNVVRSGQSVPLKFEIFEVVRSSEGDILSQTEVTTTDAIESFTQEQTDCADIGTANIDEIETTNTAGTIEPRYDTDAGQFVGNWRTPRDAAGNCYTVEVGTADDSIAAYFRLR